MPTGLCFRVKLISLICETKKIGLKRGDSHKIYSLHEPNVKCYSKGKEHKKFEFGSKVPILIDQQTVIIMGAVNFTQTLHDSKTIPEGFEQCERIHHKHPAEVFADLG